MTRTSSPALRRLVAVGKLEAGQTVYVACDPNLLIGGAPGSGKSQVGGGTVAAAHSTSTWITCPRRPRIVGVLDGVKVAQYRRQGGDRS